MVRRLGRIVATIVGAAAIVFVLTRLVPGDPIQTMLATAQAADSVAVQQYRSDFGLDQPIPVQFVRWLGHVATGDLGVSIVNRQPVTDILGKAFQASALLTLSAGTLAALGGVLLGVLAAIFATAAGGRGVAANVTTLIPLVLITLPSFSVALGLIYLFSVQFALLPPSGMTNPRLGGSAGDVAAHLVLPTIALALAPLGAMARITRAATIEALSLDFVRTAQAKGLTPTSVIFRHALRNALLPVVTNGGLMIAGLVSGAAIVETVFAWPGAGKLLIDSVLRRDYPIVEGTTLIVATLYVLSNVGVDALYSLLDPRTRRVS